MKYTKGRSFVTIMIIIAVCVLLLRIVVERIIKINIAQNESGALITLKLISTALENYAKDNHGVFPSSLSILTQTTPVYLDKDYISESPIRDYNYTCSKLEPSSYICNAIPVKCKMTGKMIYTVTTGNSITAEACSKKE